MAATTPESKGSQAQVSMSSPGTCQIGTPPPPVPPILNIPLVGTPPVRCSLHQVHHQSPAQKVGSLSQWHTQVIYLARGPMPKLQRPISAVGTAMHRAIENHLKKHQRHPLMAWFPLAVLENMTVRTTLTTVVLSLTKMSLRENTAHSHLESASGDYLTCSDTGGGGH